MAYSVMHAEGNLLINRIREAHALCATIFPLESSMKGDEGKALKPISNEFQSILIQIEEFNNKLNDLIPNSIGQQINDILHGNNTTGLPALKYFLKENRLSELSHCLVRFVMLANTMLTEFGNSQSLIERNVETSFAQLQYSLLVDETIRTKWKSIWDLYESNEIDKPEPLFEDLGRIHFLSNRIWNFSAHSLKSRTDSIYIVVKETSEKNAQALVHSEWKIVKSSTQEELAKKIQEAMKQADQYKQGILFANELSTYCYLVMVSKSPLIIMQPTMLDEKGKQYRIINIATEPVQPSIYARKLNNSKEK